MKTITTLLAQVFTVSILLLTSTLTMAQTSTIASGNWSTGSNWSAGVPASGSTATVNHAMTIDVNIVAGGTYTIAKPVTDLAGGAAYTLDVNGALNMTAQGTSVFEGALNVNNGGILTIESGDTLIVGGNSDFANNGKVNIKAGGVLIVNGDLKNDNNSSDIVVSGTIVVLGDFKGWNGSVISGSGSIQTTGSLTYQGSGETFGSTTACSTGPCGSSQFCATNLISSSQTICSGTAAAGLTANSLMGYTYQWQKSTTSFYSGFTDITTSGTGQNYSPGTLTATTYYRRKVTNGTCTVYSLPVTITVNPSTVGVTINATATTICSGTSVTFTATPTKTETVTPSYQWKVNGTNVGTNSATYTTTTLTNGQVVTCVLTSNTGCASPSTATSNSLTITVNGSNGWIGGTSTAWNTGTNWCGGIVPTSTTDVTIPGGTVYNPLISSSVNVRNITINTSGKVNVSAAGTLNIYGNYTNNGDYYDLGTTAFVGSTAQTINGLADSLNNMTINNAAGVTINATTYVKKYLTLTAGALTTNSKLTVDIYFGAILGSGSGTISGNVTVVRTIWSDKWHYISSPLSGKTVADWNTIVPIKFGAYANLYTYDETNTSTNKSIGWTAVTTTATPLTSMKGYSLYFPRGIYKTNFSMTGTYTHNQSYSISTLTNTASGVPASDGWNLVGNPYPSEIDWDAASGWTKTGIDNTVYYFDQVNNRYATYTGGTTPIGINGGTRYIPCMQGFYVKVTNPGTGTLGMTKSVRSAVANRDNWRVTAPEQQMIRLTATTGNFSDETVIRLNDEATDDFDSELDAYKLENAGNTPNLSTSLMNTNYSINSISSTTMEKTIPVKLLAAVSGTYSITADITGFNSSTVVELEDTKLDVTQNLSSSPVYSVELVAGDTTSRFYLHYKNSSSSIVTDNTNASSNEGINITAYQQQVSVNFNQQVAANSSVYVYDVVGNRLFTLENANSSSGKLEFTLPSANNGVYLVKVISSAGSKTQRVYLSK